jgi:hypothetical protein
MFKGFTYRRFGFNSLCIGFADRKREDDHTAKDGGVVTLTYASDLRPHEKEAMAKRLLGALNLASSFALDELECLTPLIDREADFGGFDVRAFCRLPASRNLVIGYDGRCPVHGVFGKNGGIALVTYADEIDPDHRPFMARRIVASLNYSRFLSLDSMRLLITEPA